MAVRAQGPASVGTQLARQKRGSERPDTVERVSHVAENHRTKHKSRQPPRACAPCRVAGPGKTCEKLSINVNFNQVSNKPVMGQLRVCVCKWNSCSGTFWVCLTSQLLSPVRTLLAALVALFRIPVTAGAFRMITPRTRPST